MVSWQSPVNSIILLPTLVKDYMLSGDIEPEVPLAKNSMLSGDIMVVVSTPSRA